MAAIHALGLHKGLAAIAAHKVVVGVAAAALVGGGATAATGSANPVVWGQQVRAIVTQCKTEREAGERGIGHCVSESDDRRNGNRGTGTATARP